ncbi:MAG: type II toxin-antitoxin system antitoxin SocA domain-containing protein ['Conium maculatum' witches'-broom phytoplasma]|nr:type II toxin-antitoxin system antitoxin SocA domain-containing protein ['Conium maculatum' witches'-broom phytoplasma]
MKDNQNIHIFDIANYLILKKDPIKHNLTPMKLQKIIFYIFSKYLVEYKKPLFNDNYEAWQYGPVNLELYLQLKKYYNQIVDHPIEGGEHTKLQSEHIEVIDYIMNKYGSMSASQLVDKTHSKMPFKCSYIESD